MSRAGHRRENALCFLDNLVLPFQDHFRLDLGRSFQYIITTDIIVDTDILVVPLWQVSLPCNLLTITSNHKIPTILELIAHWLRIIVNPSSESITSTSGHSTHLTRDATDTGDFQACTHDNDRIWPASQISARNSANSFFLGVKFIV
jgi:hypothetical protein